MAATTTALKRVVLGRPRATQEFKHTLFPKWMAMPVFSSDPFSSVAYATQEMMLVLVAAGVSAFFWVQPLAIAVAAVLAIVVVSYRQTVREYPNGGGAYIVARQNLGETPGLIAAAALLNDYVLTVAVSVSSGVEQITSVFTGLAPYAVPLALFFVVFVTLVNLRGQKESGVLFAIPTYGFIVTMGALVVFGIARCTFGTCPPAESASHAVPAVEGLTLFLILRAFASGSTALTGVEAISNGVPAFQPPKGDNAAKTLAIMAVTAIALFLGVSYLATATGVVHTEESARSVVAEVALAIFGDTAYFMFPVVQFFTAAILILAANTAYQDFPRLASVLGADRFLPRQFQARGDRLAFSNGIVVLALVAAVLIVIFKADTNKLIQLYIVGVFTGFTLSQLGMVQHWRRSGDPKRRRNILIQGFGGAVTGVVLVIVAITKFLGGAWIILVAIPLLAFTMHRIHRHYARVKRQLLTGTGRQRRGERPNHVVMLFEHLDGPAQAALSYVRSIQPASVTAYTLDAERAQERWREFDSDVELHTLDPDGDPAGQLCQVLLGEVESHPDEFVTALVAETAPESWYDELAHHRLALRVKTKLLGTEGVVVSDVVSPQDAGGEAEPEVHRVVVLVSVVNRASLLALDYAKSLHADSVHALAIELSTQTEGGEELFDEWEDWGLDVPLEVIDAPFRSLTDALRNYVHELQADGHPRVTCVLPEFVARHWYHQPLHTQTPLMIKNTLLFEPGVVTTSVPFHLTDQDIAEEATTTSASPTGSHAAKAKRG